MIASRPTTSDTRGILRPQAAPPVYRHERRDVPDELRPYVRWLWAVSWDLDDGERFVRQLVPHVGVNLSIWHGDEALINGPVRSRTERVLVGRGHVVAALFTPAGFRPLVGGHQGRFVDRIVAAAPELGPPVERWSATDRARDPDDVDGRFALLTETLAALVADRVRAVDPATALVNDAVARIGVDARITRVHQLAGEMGVGVRQLQRLFAEHVGVSPKLVIQRHRIQESADRVARGETVRWADVAHELGFADQAHLTRAFTAAIGVPPERYARECQEQAGAAAALGTGRRSVSA